MKLSRSAQKRQYEQLQKLAAALADLPAGALARLPCEEEIRAEIRAAADMRGGARRRRIKHVANLLEATGGADALYRFVAGRRGGKLLEERIRRQSEHWRKALLDEALDFAAEHEEEEWDESWESRTVRALQAELPRLDGRALTLLARRFAVTRNPRHSREIFRLLQAAWEERERGGAAG